VRVEPLLERLTASVRPQLWFLLGAAVCVLLIACANVANLLLAHASGRRLEFATRMALGANRGHLVRQAITEGLLLALTGGVAGLVLAWWALPALVALAPPTVPRLDEISVDGSVVAFAALMSLTVGLACGLVASLAAGRVDVTGALRSAAPGGTNRGRVRQGLVVAEIALALMLVIGAGLLVRTMRQIGTIDLGFNPAGVIAIGLSPDIQKYGPEGAKAQFEADLIQELSSADGRLAFAQWLHSKGQHTDVAAVRLRALARQVGAPHMRLGQTVGKIEPYHVHAHLDQLVENLRVVGGGAEGGDDFRSTQQWKPF